MKNLNKLLALLMAVVMVFSMTACAGDSDKTADDNKTPSTPAEDKQDDEQKDIHHEGDEPSDTRVALDVFAGVTVNFKPAINGFGSSFEIEYDYTKVDYDKSNTDIKEFLEGIEFSSGSYTKLSNGDKIVVDASWSKSTADTLGVKLKEESKQFTVEGMYEVYRFVEDLASEQALIDGIKAAISEEVETYIAWEDLQEYEYSVDYRYYASYVKDGNNEHYISMVYVTAVATFAAPEDAIEDPVVRFLGYNYLYQEYKDMVMAPFAEESNRVTKDGELVGTGGAVSVEEFFLP